MKIVVRFLKLQSLNLQNLMQLNYVSYFGTDIKENDNTLIYHIPCVSVICGFSYSNKEAHKYMTKLRMTLFQGRDDDESMAP